MVEVDVIVPNWNGQAWLSECLASLQSQTGLELEIIVVDNGSTDGSIELVKNKFPAVRLLELAENRGFAGAINAGIRAGSSPYVVWFNNDATAEPDCLARLLAGLKAREGQGFGMAGACVVFHDKPHIINSAGCQVGPDGLGRDRAFGQPASQPLPTREIFGPSGVVALYRREVFERAGLLDEGFFLYSEDIDFNYRAQLAGYRGLYVAEARASHRVSASARRMSGRAARLASCNGLLAVIKNWPARPLLKYCPLIAAGQLYQLGLFARQGRSGPALLGKLDAARRLPAALRMRRQIQQNRAISAREFERRIRLGRTPPRIWQRIRRFL